MKRRKSFVSSQLLCRHSGVPITWLGLGLGLGLASTAACRSPRWPTGERGRCGATGCVASR
eukprot:scaffold9818_cov63-Phaeocystis_antarctica.AAC.3